MKETLSFHISRTSGLEFVFVSGQRKALPEHSHQTTATVTLVRSGLVRLTLDNDSQVFTPGQTYLTPPRQSHRAEYLENYDLVSICLNLEYIREATMQGALAAAAVALGELTDRALLTPAEADKLLAGLDQAGPTLAAPPAPSSSVAAWLSAIANPDGLPDPASTTAGSPFQFIRRIRRELGATPHQYLLRSRVRRARSLLDQPGPITGVALEAGFYDQSHLDRWFKRIVGLTPRDYRRARRYF